jgi:acyl carrier protein
LSTPSPAGGRFFCGAQDADAFANPDGMKQDRARTALALEYRLEPQGSDAQLVIRREQLPLLTRPYIAPRTATERSLAEIWTEALSLDRVGIEDRYLDLGGDSLMAAVIFSQIELKLGVRIPMVILDSAPTIAELALRIDPMLVPGR